MDKKSLHQYLREHPTLYKDSILSLLLDDKSYMKYQDSFELVEVQEGTVVCLENELSSGLYMVLDGEVKIYSTQDGELVEEGKIGPYRSVNTYSSLRSTGNSFTVRASGDGMLLKISDTIISELRAADNEGFRYLLKVTENTEYRNLAKNLSHLGVSRQFRVRFINLVKELDLEPYQILLKRGESPKGLYYILEGQCLFQERTQNSNKFENWIAPQRTWLLWELNVSGQPSQLTLKTSTRVKVLQFSREDYNELRDHFEEDIGILEKSIFSGGQKTESSVGVSTEIDLQRLFSSTKRPRLFFWQSYPIVLQSDQMDCGPACLSMICQFNGRNVGLQFWKQKLSTDRTGTSVYDLANCADSNGFLTAPIQISSIDEIEKRYLPAIVLRKNHFVVLYDYTSSEVVVGDPQVGIKKVNRKEFNEGLGEVALLLRATTLFNDLPKVRYKYRHFFSLLQDVRREIVVGFVLSLAIIIVNLGIPIISQIFLDDVLVRRDLDWMWVTISAGIFIAFAQAGLNWVKAYYTNYISNRIGYNLNSILFKKVVNLQYKTHMEKHIGDFTRRFHDLNKIRNFLVHSGEDIMLAVVSIVVYSLVLFSYSPAVVGFIFAALPVFALITFVSGRRLTRIDREVFKRSAEAESRLTEFIKAVSSIKVIGGELASRWRFEESVLNVLREEKRYELNGESANSIFHIYFSIVRYALAVFCMYLAIDGQLSAGQVIAVTLISFSLFGPLLRLTSQFGKVQHFVAVLDRVNEILFSAEESSGENMSYAPVEFKGEIEFKDVWFRYGTESSEWILKGVSFKIEAGQNIAIVGPSGSGKSTIAALICRLIVPNKGLILIDGRNYLDYDVDWLRSQFGVLLQESPLFGGTIMENIAFSDTEVHLERVVEAAKLANAHDFISSKPSAYNYILSHGGLGISGGERQRIALARAFYRSPKVLIMDEATAALDGEAESQLMETIRSNETKGMTVVNIAHRYSSVKSSEIAIVLAKGEVVGFGTHAALELNNLTYRTLFKNYLNDKSSDKVEGRSA